MKLDKNKMQRKGMFVTANKKEALKVIRVECVSLRNLQGGLLEYV